MPSPRTTFNARVIVCVLIGLAVACNIAKAVHIDDAAYLEVARGIMAHPLRPMSGDINWEHFAEPVYRIINQPPLWPYLLAATMTVFGESDWALHGLMAIVTALVIAGFYRISARVAPRHALWTTALFASGPAFLPSQNLMTDVPLVGAWLLCMEALLQSNDPTARPRYRLAGAAIAIACLIKYTSLGLIPVLLLTLAYRRQYRLMWVVTIPIGTLGAWSAWNYAEYGGFHLFSRSAAFHMDAAGVRVLEWLTGVGAAVPFGLVLLARRGGLLSWLTRGFAVIAGWAVFDSTRASHIGQPLAPLFWGLAVCTSLTILTFIVEETASGWRDRAAASDRDDRVVLGLWLAAAMGSVVLLAPFMAMRHVLIAVPPILLLLGQSHASLLDRRWVTIPCLAISASLGIALAVSDYEHANVYRKYATQAARVEAPGVNVWASGHWGWQWYARKAGMQIYDQHSTVLTPGDYVVVPDEQAGQEILPEHRARLRQVLKVEFPSSYRSYIRAMGWGGGYYSFYWNSRTFPFAFSTNRLDEFTMYVVY